MIYMYGIAITFCMGSLLLLGGFGYITFNKLGHNQLNIVIGGCSPILALLGIYLWILNKYH